MNLYEKMLNISGKDIEIEIQNAIKETKQQLFGLEQERMCLIYSSYLYENLRKRHILTHIIDTKDLGFSFQHRFILVYDRDYYLIDLTYSQFNNQLFSKLLKEGYQNINNNEFLLYLKTIENKINNLTLEDVFTKSI